MMVRPPLSDGAIGAAQVAARRRKAVACLSVGVQKASRRQVPLVTTKTS
jgi:hypothetical protein